METRELATDVTEIKNFSSLRIKFDCGLGDNGRSLIRSRTYSNLKNDATALDVFNVANAIASLQKHSVLDIVKVDNTSLAW
ncbi:DUF1659 domain-containing protein [Clostridium chrysemydis]|uniref:DUF1659 domain-containing protein n=1 Tax=Clostridium chrysemydis TaxID=2665504 RepID=UPI003F40A30E